MDKRLSTENWWTVMNMNKTKQLIVDFRRTRNKSDNISIMGKEVEVVEEYRYLCVHLDNRHKKGESRLYFLRKLRSFRVCSRMLHIFYKSVV